MRPAVLLPCLVELLEEFLRELRPPADRTAGGITALARLPWLEARERSFE
jgi:hypothetical protein